jgi:hypothetical protein
VRQEERPRERPVANFTGRWSLTVTTPNGPVASTLDARMEPDGTLAGSISSDMGSATLTRGSVSGNTFTFAFTLNLGGNPTEITMSGTFEGNTLKGSANVGGQPMDVTGTRPGAVAEAVQGGGR